MSTTKGYIGVHIVQMIVAMTTSMIQTRRILGTVKNHAVRSDVISLLGIITILLCLANMMTDKK